MVVHATLIDRPHSAAPRKVTSNDSPRPLRTAFMFSRGKGIVASQATTPRQHEAIRSSRERPRKTLRAVRAPRSVR